jgi:peptidyl-prolyl cis-trans isomerase A (cyclophilin A)
MSRILMALFVFTAFAGTVAAQTPPPPAATEGQQEPGLYMSLDTSMGTIHCRLFEKEAPITVRTIVGLALGTKPYVDPKTRQTVRGRRFYDGLTFHRVIPRFMIQGGDPLGTGDGSPEGPGFPFDDEFVPDLRFDVPGRLAMANAGPKTNGSQFFITEIPTPYLSGKHTIFGQCEDLDVVKAIARVPAADEKPVKPVIINKVTVERVGPAPANAPEAQPAKKPAVQK